MDEAQTRTWLAFQLAVDRLGEGPLRALLQEFGDAKRIFLAHADAIAAGSGLPLVQAQSLLDLAHGKSIDRAWLQWQKIAKTNAIEILPLTSPLYPARLKTIARPPLVLYWQGAPLNVNAKVIAIVGSRSCTPYGLRMVERMVEQMAMTEQALVVLSGLALGVDGAAHQAALAQGIPTVGVLGSGLGHIYPHKHLSLAQCMLGNGGALVSEYAFNAAPCAWHFPRRNRIISGMAHAVLVVEAGVRSGALITANLAHKQGRDLWATPGNLEQSTSEGTNRLIHQGIAKIALNGADVVHALAGNVPSSLHTLAGNAKRSPTTKNKTLALAHTKNPPPTPDIPRSQHTSPTPQIENPDAKALYMLLAAQPQNPDALASLHNKSVEWVLALLLELELEGLVQRRMDGLYET